MRKITTLKGSIMLGCFMTSLYSCSNQRLHMNNSGNPADAIAGPSGADLFNLSALDESIPVEPLDPPLLRAQYDGHFNRINKGWDEMNYMPNYDLDKRFPLNYMPNYDLNKHFSLVEELIEAVKAGEEWLKRYKTQCSGINLPTDRLEKLCSISNSKIKKIIIPKLLQALKTWTTMVNDQANRLEPYNDAKKLYRYILITLLTQYRNIYIPFKQLNDGHQNLWNELNLYTEVKLPHNAHEKLWSNLETYCEKENQLLIKFGLTKVDHFHTNIKRDFECIGDIVMTNSLSKHVKAAEAWLSSNDPHLLKQINNIFCTNTDIFDRFPLPNDHAKVLVQNAKKYFDASKRLEALIKLANGRIEQSGDTIVKEKKEFRQKLRKYQDNINKQLVLFNCANFEEEAIKNKVVQAVNSAKQWLDANEMKLEQLGLTTEASQLSKMCQEEPDRTVQQSAVERENMRNKLKHEILQRKNQINGEIDKFNNDIQKVSTLSLSKEEKKSFITKIKESQNQVANEKDWLHNHQAYDMTCLSTEINSFQTFLQVSTNRLSSLEKTVRDLNIA